MLVAAVRSEGDWGCVPVRHLWRYLLSLVCYPLAADGCQVSACTAMRVSRYSCAEVERAPVS